MVPELCVANSSCQQGDAPYYLATALTTLLWAQLCLSLLER